MPIKFRCPNCRVRLSIARRKAGSKSECPRCFQALIVPADPNISDSSANSRATSKPKRKKKRKSETVKSNVGGVETQQEVSESNRDRLDDQSRQEDNRNDSIQPDSGKPVDQVSRSLVKLAEHHTDRKNAGLDDVDDGYEFDPSHYPAFPAELDQLTDEHNNAIPTGHVDEAPVAKGAMQVSRWIVYVQASLLGVVAATFFMFGLMVGNFTAAPKPTDQMTIAARVSGHIYYQRGEQQYGDEGAVVLLLPADKVPADKLDPEAIAPDTFLALNNPSRELIESIGGAIVRVEADGSFKASIKGPGKFWMLVVSNAQDQRDEDELTKEQIANLGAYVYPVDAVINGRAYQFKEFTVKSTTRELADIVF